jgi:lysine 2,3-aminomutase
MRIDDALARLLRRFAPLFVVTHFNHPRELTPEARQACERLVDHGVPVENQAVLLRGLNSTARILGDLFETLLTWRVRPYYLHQGDLAAGTGHLRTPLAAGVEILRALRGRVSGLAIPHLAVDLPSGGGKVVLAPDYRDGAPPLAPGPDGATWLVDHHGQRVRYPAPPSANCDCPYDAVYYPAGGAGERMA